MRNRSLAYRKRRILRHARRRLRQAERRDVQIMLERMPGYADMLERLTDLELVNEWWSHDGR